MFQTKRRWKKIDRKTAAITLLIITACAAIGGGLLMTTQASSTNSTTTDTTTTTSDLNSISNNPQLWGMSDMNTGDQSFGGAMGPGRGHGGFMGGMRNVEVSSEYTANVNAILGNDTDVQNLISEGYNVTSINPIVKNVIQADGTLVTKATTAIVTLQNGTSGYATANVDIEQAKVTQIVIITRTVIDKTTSTS